MKRIFNTITLKDLVLIFGFSNVNLINYLKNQFSNSLICRTCIVLKHGVKN
jgi:hypothetical protein